MAEADRERLSVPPKQYLSHDHTACVIMNAALAIVLNATIMVKSCFYFLPHLHVEEDQK
jgi:hypothetical protein